MGFLRYKWVHYKLFLVCSVLQTLKHPVRTQKPKNWLPVFTPPAAKGKRDILGGASHVDATWGLLSLNKHSFEYYWGHTKFEDVSKYWHFML